MSSAIFKLPNDIQHQIFTYCGDVARAASCSVSSQWYERVLNVSKSLSALPQFYTLIRPRIKITRKFAAAVLTDYHLTVRIHDQSLLYRKESLCIAGNQSVCELFIRLGCRPRSVDVIFSRNRWFHETMPVNLSNYNEHECGVYLVQDLLEHGCNDAFIEYFNADLLTQCLPEYKEDDEEEDLIEFAIAVIESKDIRVVQRVLQCNQYYVGRFLLDTIVMRDAVDLIPAMSDWKELSESVCKHGSIAMFTRARETAALEPIEKLIKHAFEGDNIELFDYMVSQGAPMGHLNFLDGIAHRAFKCSMRIAPLIINTREIICHILGHWISISKVMEHFQFSQDDFNQALIACLRMDVSDTTELVLHANNYDKEAYEQYGVIIILDEPLSIG